MKHVQFIRESTANANARVGLQGEITIDVDAQSLRIHDGATAGGHEVFNESQRAAISQSEFSATTTTSVPGVLPDSILGQFADVTVAGTYTLPALAAAIVGQRIVISAAVTGVVIAAAAGELITDKASVNAASIAVARYETVAVTKKSDTHWVIVSRY